MHIHEDMKTRVCVCVCVYVCNPPLPPQVINLHTHMSACPHTYAYARLQACIHEENVRIQTGCARERFGIDTRTSLTLALL